MRAHILVVDDDHDIAEPLVNYLSQFGGYHVSVAHSGAEAIIALNTARKSPHGPIDIVLLDMRMPDISGLDVLAWIRQQADLRYTRVLMLTATIGHEEKIKALSAGADDYITKPYQYQELLARVRTNLRSRELEKQLQWQSRQLAALNQVTRTVAGYLDIQRVLASALDGVKRIFNVELAAVFTLANEQLTCWSLRPDDGAVSTADFLAIPAGEGMIGRACAERTVLYFNEEDDYQPLFMLDSDAPAGFQARSMMAAGLALRSRTIGTLVGWNKDFGEFNEFDADLFKSLANGISQAIENAWLVDRLERRQHDLLNSRNRLQAVTDGILQPIYTVDAHWELIAVNKNQADKLETTPAELVGKTCYEAFHERDAPCEHCQVAETLARKQAASWSTRWLGQDHLPEEWAVSAYPLPTTESGTDQAVVVWLDRTEERRLESSLMQAGKLAAIGQLAAGVAHEINNPLTAINVHAEILRQMFPEDSEEFDMVDIIGLAGARAAKVVKNLLNAARQEQYQFEDLSINESIQQALDLVWYQLQSAEIEVEQSFGADLPLITASNEHLKSVWINLLVNAVDALKEMETDRRLGLFTQLIPEGTHIQILIQDNGVGMTSAQVGHIFEPFYTTKDPDKGTGLGLATCYRIVEQHGGQIDVLSQPGEGTSFIILLPVDSPQRQEFDDTIIAE